MGSIRSSIELQDNFTNILMSVINVVNMSVSTMEQMQSVVSEPVDTSAILGMRDQLTQAALAAQELGAALQDMGAADATSAANWVNQSTIQVSTNTGIQRLTDEMDFLDQMSEDVLRCQQRINEQALNMELLPRNASWDINDISQRITTLSGHLQNLQGYDADLLGNDGAEQISRQYETIRTNMNSIINLQVRLDQAIQEGDVSGLNQGYNQLNQMIVQVEQQARSTQQTLNSLTNVEWHSSGAEIFTGNGMERFRQEVQSTNNMLSTLNNMQGQIAARAGRTSIFPSNMVTDMTGMQSRLQNIRSQIRTIESNPMNMGTDTANAELEQLRNQLQRAVQEQESMNRAVENMDIQAANEAYLRLSQIIDGTERHIRDNVDEQGRLNHEIRQGAGEANELVNAIMKVVAAYATIQTISNVLDLSDQLASTTARLNMMNDGLQTTQDLQNMIYLSAENARGAYQATADSISKLGLMAGDAFSSSEEIIAFMEQVNKQFRIAGTEASGIDAAMLQLTQAMGSGVLRGEEYNSILEQAPNIIQTIADYLEVPKGKLKDMAAEGKITADIVKAAMFAAAADTNTQFESMPMTFEQIWTSFENTALMALQPLLNNLNQIANNDVFQQVVSHAVGAMSMLVSVANPIINKIANTQALWNFVDGIVDALSLAGIAALEIFDLLASGALLVVDNWSWIGPVIYGVVGALAVYYGWQMAANAIELIRKGGHVAMAAAQMLHAAATGQLTAATAAEIAAQNGLNAAMYACPIVWIIIGIIAFISIIYAAVAVVNKLAGTSVSAMGIICGAFMALVAFILNAAIGGVNALIQLVWSFVEPFIGLIEFILNAANGGFDSFGGAVANLIGQIISWFLSLGEVVTKIIDAIFGTNWTAGLNELQAKVLEWGKNDNAITLDREAPAIDARFEYSAAWDTGYSFGEGIDESIANFDPASLFGTTDIPSADDYASALTAGGIGSGIDDISGNTGAMADAMDITGEELKYLRDMAEQETINRFTTARITIEQTNHNSIKNGMDLDGIVSTLTDAVTEAVVSTAEGVHM